MVWDRLGQLGRPLVVMLAVILMLVLVDVGIVAVRLTSGHPVGSQRAGQQDGKAAKHPCNHGNEGAIAWNNATGNELLRWQPGEPIDDGRRAKCSLTHCRWFPLERHPS